MEANYQTKSKKWWKILLGIIIGLVVITGGLYVYDIVTDDSPPNDYAILFNQSLDSLYPTITRWDKIDCSDLDNEKERTYVFGGDVGKRISNQDYCYAIEAIEAAEPALCNKMSEYADICSVIARWQDIDSCLTTHTEVSTRNNCIHRAVISAYEQGRSGQEVWGKCDLAEPDDGWLNYQVYCYASAAVREHDTAICEHLTDKQDIKDCKAAARWQIERSQK